MPDKSEMRYSAEHEWVLVSGDIALVGVSEYAVDKLGDVVYVDLPAPGSRVEAGSVIGEIESTKSVSELYSPVSGEVIEINEAVVEDPALVNASAEQDAWLLKVRVVSLGELMDWSAYREHTRE